MSQTFQDHEIRQYLLGDLSPAEEEQIETTYFRQPDLLARIELARDDLADDYAAGRLSEVDREKFERRLLATDEGREQLAITKGLQQNASRRGAALGDSPKESGESNDPNDRE